VSLVQPFASTRDLNHREVIAGRLVVPGGDGAEAFDVVKEAFDAIADSVQRTIETAAAAFAVRFAADHDFHSTMTNASSKPIRVVAAVANQCATLCIVQQFVGLGHLVPVAGGQRDVERPAFRVDDRMDFRGESTSRTTQCVSVDPPFSPAAS